MVAAELGETSKSLVLMAYEDSDKSSTLVRWLAQDGTTEVVTCPLALFREPLIQGWTIISCSLSPKENS
jgi:hypothetical protein